VNKFFTIVTLTIIVSSLAFGYEVGKQGNTGRIVGVWKSINNINNEPQAVVTVNKSEKQLEGKFVFRGLTHNGQENVTLELPITNASFDGTAFSFRVTFPGTEKMVTDWELKLRKDDEAAFDMVKENDKPAEDAPSFVMKRARTN
jgi:hypothetical protein